MIQIKDNDLPIQAAGKIISGTRDVPTSSFDKAVCKAFTGQELGDTAYVDMFDLKEIKEIADYLMVYYESHINKD